MKSILFIFNRYFYFALISLLIQQSIVASSTYFVSEVAKKVALGEEVYLSLLLFIFSLIIVYFPASIASFFLEKSKIIAVRTYIDHFFERYFNQFSQTYHKEEISAVVASESFSIMSNGTYFLFDVVSILLNVLTNVIVLSIVLEGNIIGYYLLGICFSCGVVLFTKSRISQASDHAQTSTNRYKGVLLSFWDNICLGNMYNRQRFITVLNQHYHHYLKTHLTSVLTNNIATNLGMIVMIIPIAYYTLDFFQQNRSDGAILAVLVATLPRQIMMVQYAYEAIHQSIDFLGLSARFTLLDDYLTKKLSDENTFLTRIQMDKITLISTEKNQPDLTALLANHFPNHGRMTIRGSNGVGKSSLLQYLKQKNGESIFYLPANSMLFFDSTMNKTLSTGEKIHCALLELLNNDEGINVVLLDEWDANLDSQTMMKIDHLINTFSQGKLVIEVRHR